MRTIDVTYEHRRPGRCDRITARPVLRGEDLARRVRTRTLSSLSLIAARTIGVMCSITISPITGHGDPVWRRHEMSEPGTYQ